MVDHEIIFKGDSFYWITYTDIDIYLRIPRLKLTKRLNLPCYKSEKS